jgi:hypothetical protein
MKFQNNVPVFPKGLEHGQISFSGGRLMASIAEHGGLTHLDYFGEQRFGDTRICTGDPISAWAQVFRVCLSVDGLLCYLEFNDTAVYPFGYTSHSAFNGVSVCHEMMLLNDALVHRIKILRNSKKKKIAAAKFLMGHVLAQKPTRTWSGFKIISPENIFEATIHDEYTVASHAGGQFNRGFKTQEVMSSETYVALTADRPLRFAQPNDFKQNLHTAPFKDTLTISLVCGHTNHDGFVKRTRELQKSAGREMDKLVADYKKSLPESAATIPNKSVQSFLANTRAMLDSVKVKDLPGGMRGANSGFWIWGWDSFVYSHVHGLHHDNSFAVEMLKFFKQHADPELGIFMSMTLDLKPFIAMEPNAQCLYAVMLYDVYLFGGDKAVLHQYFDFAMQLVDRAGREEVGDTGLVRGFSLYPDNVATLSETGDDISAINNSIYFQALRSMEALAREIDRSEIAEDLKSRGDRLAKNFERLFDAKQGFFYTSMSASDCKPRQTYGVQAIFWITPFARELIGPHAPQIARFMKKHLKMPHGFRLMPTWDPSYMRDGNNNGYYDPYVERFYLEMIKAVRDKGGVDDFYSNVEWFWNQLNVPEAMTAEMENHGLTVDNPGRQQPFGVKVWNSIFFHTLAGMELDSAGLTFTAADAGPIKIKNLLIRGKRLDIDISGRGWKIGKLSLDGKPIAAPFHIPFASLKKHSIIKLQRTSGKTRSTTSPHKRR